MRLTFAIAILFAFSAAADVTLPRATSPVTLDGELTEEAWKSAAVLDQFYEYLRSDNEPSPVPTIAYVMYDDQNLYVGVDCRDPEPAKIRAPYVDRDQVFADADSVIVVIDSRGEGKVALELRMNPRGIQGDAVMNDSTDSEDFSPDFFYDTAAKITATGWTAEFRIPLSTLRYTNSEPQTWGITVIRNWPRDFRYTVASNPIPRNSNCFVCHATKFTGITDLPTSQHLILAPYVSAQQSARPREGLGTPLETRGVENDVGFDLKWSPTSSTALDGTLNPDFSQIEADVAQIAANQRFALFYAEKRPFFLEGSDLLQTEIDAVYTRTISAPRWGARGTGQHDRTSWTMLLTEDRGGGSLIIPGPLGSDLVSKPDDSLNLIGRARHEIGRSAIGMLVTARESDGDGGHNRVIGPDFEWRPNEASVVVGQLLLSDTQDPYTDGTSHAFELEYAYTTKAYDFAVGLEDYGDEFRADNGFVPQVGYRELSGGGGYNIYPKDSTWVQIRPNGGFAYVTSSDGDEIHQDVNFGAFVSGKRNSVVHAYLHHGEDLTGGKLIDQTYLEYIVSVDPSKRWSKIVVSGRFGEDIDFANATPARSIVASVSTIVRPTPKLQAELRWSHEQLDARETANDGRLYTAGVQRLKMTYSFTSKSLLRVIGQYVETDFEPERYTFPVPEKAGSFLASLLYSYKLNWQTVLFVGYGDDRVLDKRADLLKANRTLFAKISYAWQM